MLLSLLKSLVHRTAHPPTPNHGPAQPSPGQREFSNLLISDFLRLAHQTTEDNYDHRRYDLDGKDHSMLFDVGTHTNYLHTYFEHAEAFFAVYNLFTDRESRDLFRRLILYRMLGHLHVVIKEGTSWTTELAMLDKAKTYDTGESSLTMGGMWGNIRHHEGIPTPGGPIALDCWTGNVMAIALKKQYFFSRGPVTIEPATNDIVIDAGACFGDTAVYFAKATGPGGHVFAFDPLPAHKSVIDFNIRQNGLIGQISIVQSAVGDKTFEPTSTDKQATLDSTTARPDFALPASSEEFAITTLDDFVETRGLERIDFIKMDIEGYELPALIGATHLIARFKPKLAISLYHRPTDFIEIPLWLRQHFPFYDMYLDHHTIHREETVLYAVARPELHDKQRLDQ